MFGWHLCLVLVAQTWVKEHPFEPCFPCLLQSDHHNRGLAGPNGGDWPEQSAWGLQVPVGRREEGLRMLPSTLGSWEWRPMSGPLLRRGDHLRKALLPRGSGHNWPWGDDQDSVQARKLTHNILLLSCYFSGIYSCNCIFILIVDNLCVLLFPPWSDYLGVYKFCDFVLFWFWVFF